MYIKEDGTSDSAETERMREMGIEYKPDAAFTAFCELGGVINKTHLASQYFKKTRGWFSRRLDGCVDNEDGREVTFTEKEFHQLAESFRDIAKRLRAHADEIDAAEYIEWDD